MRKVAHIINPVRVDESSDLFTAQPVTFKTMEVARDFARNQVDVGIFSAQYPEDRAMVPEYFQLTPDMERSVLDIATFKKKRKLPLVKDILDRLYEVTDADFLIYTNVDIALMPYFYVSVIQIIESGYDAFVINRRTIPKRYERTEQIPNMYSLVGQSHRGYDCFVFPRRLYPFFKLGEGCIGANHIGKILITNLVCLSKNFKLFKNLHLTFHIGNDKAWNNSLFNDYFEHNKKVLGEVLSLFAQEKRLAGRPLVNKYFEMFATGEQRHTAWLDRIFRGIKKS